MSTKPEAPEWSLPAVRRRRVGGLLRTRDFGLLWAGESISGFGSATRVKFGALPASQVTLVSGTQLTAVAPPQGPGTVDLELVNPDNQNAVLHQAFTYV